MGDNRSIVPFVGDWVITKRVIAFEDVKRKSGNPCLLCLVHVKDVYLTFLGGGGGASTLESTYDIILV